MKNLTKYLLLLFTSLLILLSFAFYVEKVAAQTQQEITACAVTCMDNDQRLKAECKFGNRYLPAKTDSCQIAYDNCFSNCKGTLSSSPTASIPAAGNPVALITIQSNNGFVVDFSADSTFGGTPPYNFSWAYGEGFGDTGSDPAAHTYATAGDKTITLTVTDSAAGFNVRSITVTVAGSAITPTPIPDPKLTWQRIAFCSAPTPTSAPTVAPIAIAPTKTPTPTPAPIAIVPTSSPAPTPASASTACSSAKTCATCIFGQTQSACGWNGSSCENRPGQKACPAGYSQWNWTDCSKNECSLLAPTPIPPTPTPLPATTNTVCPIETNENRIVKCDRTNPNIGVVCNPLFQQKGLIPCQPDDICWICRFPTPTPIPGSQCTVNDCGGPGACAVGSSCQQVAGAFTKQCTCQSSTAPTPTPTPAPTSAPTPKPGSSLLALSVKIPGLGILPPESLPRTKSRPVTVIVRTATGDVEKKGVIIFSPSDGTFKTDPKRSVDLGTDIPINVPLDLVIKADFFKGFVSDISLSSGPNPAPQTQTLKVGLDDSENVDAVSYFNALISCFSQKSCTNKLAADLNDDGNVDGIDFNIFLKSIRAITSS